MFSSVDWLGTGGKCNRKEIFTNKTPASMKQTQCVLLVKHHEHVIALAADVVVVIPIEPSKRPHALDGDDDDDDNGASRMPRHPQQLHAVQVTDIAIMRLPGC
jgi:hypothetical protein